MSDAPESGDTDKNSREHADGLLDVSLSDGLVPTVDRSASRGRSGNRSIRAADLDLDVAKRHSRRLLSEHHRDNIGGEDADGRTKKDDPKQVKNANFPQAVWLSKSLGMNDDLKNRASSVEPFNVGTPSQAREKQATHQQKVTAQ